MVTNASAKKNQNIALSVEILKVSEASIYLDAERQSTGTRNRRNRTVNTTRPADKLTNSIPKTREAIEALASASKKPQAK
jgi:hypothetical protein